MNALIRIQWLGLVRDRGALALTYVLPIAFFSIFALVFGSMGASGTGGGSKALRVLIVDEDRSEASERFLAAFERNEGIRLLREFGEPKRECTREDALSFVRAGDVPAVVLIPKGFGTQFGSFTQDGCKIELVFDAANPFAQHMLTGQLQAASFQAAPDLLLQNGLDTLREFGGGPLTQKQEDTLEELIPLLKESSPGSRNSDGSEGEASDGFTGLISIDARAAQADEEEDEGPNMVAYYAAAIGVMFLLFSMAGAAGSILEQEEYGVLERILTSNVTVTKLLQGHWVFFTVMGVVQLAVMFAWGALVFGLEMSAAPTLVGSALMSIVTSGAAAAFGLMLAAVCRSRAQLSGVSTIVILTMSALGGSMMPKFIASFLETTSQFTFNGWALDGFLKVFWYREPDDGVVEIVQAILPQVGLLLAATIVFLAIARFAARKWELV